MAQVGDFHDFFSKDKLKKENTLRLPEAIADFFCSQLQKIVLSLFPKNHQRQ
jgi:hypothetical protein